MGMYLVNKSINGFLECFPSQSLILLSCAVGILQMQHLKAGWRNVNSSTSTDRAVLIAFNSFIHYSKRAIGI